jgi:hypothetical protein
VDYAKINFVIIFAAILMPRWWNRVERAPTTHG